ncbi:MAG TPA: zinc-dependent metalloprotease [Rhodothermia bacterium]|nr:zinc-dependent metalloprotease [Rhodothermia bacterium]
MIRYYLAACALLMGTQGCFILPRSSAPTPKTAAQKKAEAADSAERAAGLKPYAKVITTRARTTDGLFRTHRVGDTLYFEIPRRELNKDMLLVGRFARASGGTNYGGDEFTERVLRWERQGNRILLRSVTFEITADSVLPVYRAVTQASYPPIVAAFPVESYGPDSSAVIDVTRLYTTNVPEFVGARGNFDEKRSFIERVDAFPDNVEVEATQTATPDHPPDSQRGLGPIPAASILAHWSMVRLPERPMMPRLADKRVGYFTLTRTDYGTPQQRAVPRSYITRWRLEKMFPDSALSEPVKPIVYYVDPATPAQWIPWIKRGIEDWQPAFEAAGFRRAIIAKDAPSPAEDPRWSPEDVRNTVIRWLPSTTENAMGPTVVDPRSGEIMNGSARVFHNVMNLVRNWYFTQVSPLDSRAQRLPFPEPLMGRLVEYIVAHEVGHTLGLQHNMKASSTYPADSVRSATWVRKMGHSPSLMDYARLNYVAQPEDRIDPADLVPRVGPYDMFAIMWGYKPIHGVRTPDAERPALNSWAQMQDTISWYRFSTSGDGGVDPGDESEAVGDADAVKSTGYGLRNIRRVVRLLMPATLRPGEDNAELVEIYERLIDQWSRELEHVVNVIGGAESREKYGGQLGPRFVPLPHERQKVAMKFLNENAFTTPLYLLDTQILRRMEPEGALRRINSAQSRILAAVLENDRLARLSEYQALATFSAKGSRDVYPVPELLADLRAGIWSELLHSSVRIDPFRRALQRSYLAQADAKINPAPAIVITSGPTRPSRARVGTGPNTDMRALLRGELTDLDEALRSAMVRAADRETRLHMLDARAEIKRILDPPR